MSDKFIPALRFNALTPFYDPIVRLTTRERRAKQALIDAAAIAPGSTVLDLGCGTGTLTVQLKLAHPDCRVIGLDADAAILSYAREKADSAGVTVEFVQGDAADIPLPNGVVQRVVSSLFFHHLLPEKKIQVMCEALRVLDEGGQLHISDWGRPSSPVMRWLFYPVQWLDGFATTNDSVAGALAQHAMSAGATYTVEHDYVNTMLGTLRQLMVVK